MIVRHTFTPHNNTRLSHLCGPMDAHLRSIEAGLQVSIAHRHEQFKVDGPKAQAQRAMELLQALYERADRPIAADMLQLMLAGDAALDEDADGAQQLHTRRADLKARTPGDLSQKVDPYLRPLYDALYDLMGFERVQKAFERNALEIAPLAFMRGRTLNNAFVILDEAQNTTPEQMKMFLTRIGFGAKAVITGDVSQIDLPKGQMSGLIDAERVLKRVKGIAFTRFTTADVVRHPLVARIVDAYDAQGSAPRRRTAD